MVKDLFTKHPSESGETYIAHLFTALKYSIRLLWAATAVFIHAFFPFVHQNTASSICHNILGDVKDRFEQE